MSSEEEIAAFHIRRSRRWEVLPKGLNTYCLFNIIYLIGPIV